jgi:sec-independent protein translocase protein TatA
MSLGNLGGHWWVILIIVVLLFGAPKLPALARSMGQSMRIFKNEIKTKEPEADAGTVPPTVVPPTADQQAAAPRTGDTARSTDSGDTAAKP